MQRINNDNIFVLSCIFVLKISIHIKSLYYFAVFEYRVGYINGVV